MWQSAKFTPIPKNMYKTSLENLIFQPCSTSEIKWNLDLYISIFQPQTFSKDAIKKKKRKNKTPKQN